MLVYSNASILAWKQRPYIQRKHSGHHRTDLHIIVSPQLTCGVTSHGHMLASRCSTMSCMDSACMNIVHNGHNFTLYIGYMNSISCSNFQLCSGQGTSCHQSLAESSHFSKHEARIFSPVLHLDAIGIHTHGEQDAHSANVLFPCMKH